MAKYLSIVVVCLALSVSHLEAQRRSIEFTNRCPHDIWIAPLTNNQGPSLPEGIVRLANGGVRAYSIPDAGWGGRFWPKTGCDGNGQNCEMGQSVPPCNAGGCDPPAETKVEFHFPPAGNSDDVWYDVSLVDGYSLPAEIIPSQFTGSCVTTNCAVSLAACPTEGDVGDLKVNKNGRTVACLSPCKKWNYPAPYGLGRDEHIAPGIDYCCPTPPIQPAQCSSGPVIRTRYVDLIHRTCPSAYSYAYDDHAGLHNCPTSTSFKVIFCQ